MGQTSSDDQPQLWPALAREGVVRLPTHTLDQFLAARGPLRGPVTDAGTRALEEQRGERV